MDERHAALGENARRLECGKENLKCSQSAFSAFGRRDCHSANGVPVIRRSLQHSLLLGATMRAIGR